MIRKNILSTVIVAVMFVIGVTAFVSCEKEKTDNFNVLNKGNNYKFEKEGNEYDEIYNKNNPYDIYGNNIKNFYYELKLILEDDKNKDKKEFDKELNSLIDKYGNAYPVIDTSNYSDNESAYISELITLYNKTNDIKYASQIIEKKLYLDNNLKNYQKERLLSLISQYKYNTYYSLKILNVYCKSWDNDFDNCMKRELNDIFADDGNPVPETVFIIGLPESLFALQAECAWEATFLK